MPQPVVDLGEGRVKLWLRPRQTKQLRRSGTSPACLPLAWIGAAARIVRMTPW
jgi:hypothetical protein